MHKRELAHEITDKLQKNPAVAILALASLPSGVHPFFLEAIKKI